ncbi:MAG: pyrroline-5-carboxylate reductase [Clostridiales bacterium]|nr:pyrroline-5-carboxylate reductase [Clostridiales bacterium]
MKIGMIGSGNIAEAMMSGCTKSGKFDAKDIYVFDIFREKAEKCAEKYGVNVAESAKDVAGNCDAVILAVKPKDFPDLLRDVEGEISKNGTLVVSPAAGLSLSRIEGYIGFKPHLARIMTNINAAIRGAMTAYCFNELVSDDEKKFIAEFTSSFGGSLELPEDYFPQFGVLAGCGPAFAYMFVEEFARAGVEIGINKKMSLEIAAQTILGSAKMILESGAHPYELVDRVCTPAGTTIDGVTALQENGFANAVIKAIEKSYEKDRRLAEKK